MTFIILYNLKQSCCLNLLILHKFLANPEITNMTQEKMSQNVTFYCLHIILFLRKLFYKSHKSELWKAEICNILRSLQEYHILYYHLTSLDPNVMFCNIMQQKESVQRTI